MLSFILIFLRYCVLYCFFSLLFSILYNIHCCQKKNRSSFYSMTFEIIVWIISFAQSNNIQQSDNFLYNNRLLLLCTYSIYGYRLQLQFNRLFSLLWKQLKTKRTISIWIALSKKWKYSQRSNFNSYLMDVFTDTNAIKIKANV